MTDSNSKWVGKPSSKSSNNSGMLSNNDGQSLPSINSSLDFKLLHTVIPQKPVGASLPKQAFSAQFIYGQDGKLEILKEADELKSIKSEEDEISRMLGIPDINPKPTKQPKRKPKKSYANELWDCLHSLEQNTAHKSSQLKAVK